MENNKKMGLLISMKKRLVLVLAAFLLLQCINMIPSMASNSTITLEETGNTQAVKKVKLTIGNSAVTQIEFFKDTESLGIRETTGDMVFSATENGSYSFKAMDTNKIVLEEKEWVIEDFDDFFVTKTENYNEILIGSRMEGTTQILEGENNGLVTTVSEYGMYAVFVAEEGKEYVFHAVDKDGKELKSYTYPQAIDKVAEDENNNIPGIPPLVLNSENTQAKATPRAASSTVNYATPANGARVVDWRDISNPQNILNNTDIFIGSGYQTDSNPSYITVDLGQARTIYAFDLLWGSWPNFAGSFMLQYSNSASSGFNDAWYRGPNDHTNGLYNNGSGCRGYLGGIRARYWKVLLYSQTFPHNGLYGQQLKLLSAPNTNADIRTMQFAPGIEISPAFDNNVTSYTLSVPATAANIGIKANPWIDTSLLYKGNSLFNPNEFTYASLDSTSSSGSFVISSMAEYGNVKNYTFTWYRKAKSTDNYLSEIKFNPSSGVTMSPTFSPAIFDYDVDVPDISSIGVCVIPRNAGATVFVGTDPYHRGPGYYYPISGLNTSNQKTPIVVTDEYGNKRTYNLNIRRRSSVTTLSGLQLNNGDINYTFNSNTTNYTVEIPNTMTSVAFKPTLTQDRGSIKINGVAVGNNGTYHVSFPDGSKTMTVAVVVVGENANYSKTYTYTLNKTYRSLTYILNGGTANNPVDTKAYKDGEIATIDFTTKPTRTNYHFLGYSQTASDTTPTYTEGGTETVLITKDTTLYAIWKAKTNVTIEESKQTVTYDGTSKSFAIKGTPTNNFNVTYKQGSIVVTPSEAGVYDVYLTRSEDDTYASYSRTLAGGLVIVYPALSGSPAFVSGDDKACFGTEIKVGAGTLNVTSNLHYKWYRSNDDTYDVGDTFLKETTAYTPVKADIGKYLIVEASSDKAIGTKVLVLNDVIKKGSATKPSGLVFSLSGTKANKIVGTTDKMEYSIDGGVTYQSCTNTDTDLLLYVELLDETKDIRVRYKATDTAFESEALIFDLKKGSKTLASTEVVVTDASSKNTSDGKIEITIFDSLEVGQTLEYKKVGASKYAPINQKVTENLSPSVYYIRYAANELTLAGEDAEAWVKPCLIGKAVYLTNENKFGSEIAIGIGTLAPTTNIKYTWYRSINKDYQAPGAQKVLEGTSTSTKYTPVKEDVGKYLIVVAESEDAAGVQLLESEKIQKEAGATVSGITFSFDGTDAGSLVGTSDQMEYSIDQKNTWIHTDDEKTLISDAQREVTKDNDIYIRLKETDTHLSGESQKIDIVKTSTQVSGVTTSDCTTEANNDGKIKSVDTTMEYRKEGEVTYTPISGVEVTNLTYGTYYVRLKATGLTLPGPDSSVVVRKCLTDATILAEEDAFVYGNELTMFVPGVTDTLTYAWFCSDDTVIDSSDTVIVNISNKYKPKKEDVGKYIVVRANSALGTSTAATAVSIGRRVAQASYEDYEGLIYDGTKKKIEVSIKNVMPDDSYTAAVDNNENINAETYTSNLVTDLDTNYYEIQNGSLTYDIMPKEVYVKWESGNFRYDGTVQMPKATIESGVVGDELQAELSIEMGNGIDVGNYAVNATQSNGNYTLDQETTYKEYSIAKAKALPLTAEGVKEEYYISETPEYEVSGKTEKAKYTYRSSNPEVARVDPTTGKIKLQDAGTFHLEIKASGDTNYEDSEYTKEGIQVKERHYTVKYDSDGGSKVNKRDDIKWRDHYLYPKEAVSKEGYTFIGWFDETGKPISDETKYKDLVEKDTVMEITLKAHWTKNPVVPLGKPESKPSTPNGNLPETTPTEPEEVDKAVNGYIENGKVNLLTTIPMRNGKGKIETKGGSIDIEITMGLKVQDLETLVNAVLTTKQIEKINQGEDIKIRIVSKETKGASDKEVIQKKAKAENITIGKYYDITMQVYEEKWKNVEELSDEVEITLNIDKAILHEDVDYKVIHAHKGKTEVLKDLDDVMATFTFKTDGFSTYMIGYVTPEKKDQTGVIVFILAIALVGTGYSIYRYTRRKQ